MNHLKDQRGVAFVVEVVLVVIVLVIVGLAVYASTSRKASPTVATSTSPSPSKSVSPDPYAGWKQGSLASENVTFNYPSNWTLTTDSGSNYIGLLTLADKRGFSITIDAFKTNTQNASLGGSLGAVTFNTTVSKLTLGGKAAYLIDSLDAKTGMYSGTVLSACTGSKKCLFTSPKTGNDIEITITYHTPGEKDFSGGPEPFSPTADAYKEALLIANSVRL